VGAPSGGGGTGNAGVGPGSGGITGAGGGATGGANNCGLVQTETGFRPIPPDILVVFDRSATMGDDANGESCDGGCGGASKWSMLAAGMENVIGTNPQINWGLSLYGGDQTCGVSGVVAVPVGPSTLSPIETTLASARPAGFAPASAAIANAVNYLDTLFDAGPKYIMLVTDGHTSCGSPMSGENNTALNNAIASAAAVGWPTFVVAIAPSSDTMTINNLNLLAQTGGYPNTSGYNAFYAPADLGPVLTTNVRQIGSCTLLLSEVPGPGVALSVNVTAPNGVPSRVPEDPATGWSFTDGTETSITFNGSWCGQIQSGGVTQVTIVYSCPILLHE
jgi:hypothetical protein